MLHILKALTIFFCCFFTTFGSVCSAQSPILQLLKQKKTKQFTYDSKPLVLNKIVVNDPYSNWDGLTLCWLRISKDFASIEIRDVSKEIKTETQFTKLARPKDIVVINGGFCDSNKNYNGLVIIDYAEKGAFVPWESGGFLIQDQNQVQIWPVKTHNLINFKKTKYALQSKPLVVESGKTAVEPSASERRNRIGIGLYENGDLFVCVAVSNNDHAISLFELGELLSSKEQDGGPGIQTFLALDGGPSVNFYIPCLNYFLGLKNPVYIANSVHFIKKN